MSLKKEKLVPRDGYKDKLEYISLMEAHLYWGNMRALCKKKSEFVLPSSPDVSLTLVPCPVVTVVEHIKSAYNVLVVIDRRRREKEWQPRKQK